MKNNQNSFISSSRPAPLTLHQHSLISSTQLRTTSDRPDSVIWTATRNGVFSVRSAYKTMAVMGKLRSPLNSIWKAKVTPTMRIFFLLLLNNRILTQEVMPRRNFSFQHRCCMCANCPSESTVHLFFFCPYAVHLWTMPIYSSYTVNP